MGKIRLAMIGDTLYAGRLSEYFRKNAPDYLEVLSCPCFQDLTDFLTRTRPDILLYEREVPVEGHLPKYMVQAWLTDEGHGKYLYENAGIAQSEKNAGNIGDAQSEANIQNGKSGMKQDAVIFRYQRGSEILRQVFQIYEKQSKKNLVCRCQAADMEMTAFYAPGGHELLLPFSVSYAALCGENAKALYLNLSEFSGMVPLFGEKQGKNLSDLIYDIRQKKENFFLCLQSVLHHTEQFDYILPPENPQDLYEMREEDLACLLKMLQEQTEYTQIIWNCGTLNQAAEQVMECCHKVYCVVKENSFGKYRRIELERFLKKELKKRIREKVVYVSPQTVNGGFVAGMDILAQLQRGEFAEHVRKLTRNNEAI